MKNIFKESLYNKLLQLNIFVFVLISIILYFFINISYAYDKSLIIPNTNHVFIISSYHVGDPCGQPQFDAVIEALQHSRITNLSFTGHFLDTRRNSEHVIKQKIEFIKEDILTLKPKVIVTLDDPSFSLLYKFVMNIPDTFLVFSGLNKCVQLYNEEKEFLTNDCIPIKNITGVFEYMFIKEQLTLMEEILNKQINKVAILYSEDSVSPIIAKQLVNEVKNSKYEDVFILYSVKTIEDMIKTSYTINEDNTIDVWIPATLSILNEKNEKILMSNTAKIMTSIIYKPDLSLNASFTEYGFFGGVSVDFYQMGYQAGLLVAKLLQGIDIKELPIENTRNSYIAINLNRSLNLNINISQNILSKIDMLIE